MSFQNVLGVTPKIEGRGEVRRSALGRYVGYLLRIGHIPPQRHPEVRARLLLHVWEYLINSSAITEEYVKEVMEELHIDRMDTAKEREIWKVTSKLIGFFDQEIKKYPDMDIKLINQNCPVDFLK